MNGILRSRFAWFDYLFPYVLDPLMGHTWNTYYFHHVKHHHVEGNGPKDLSTTIRYERDNPWHLAHYVGRFFFGIWIDLPQYFFSKGKYKMAARAFISEIGCISCVLLLATRVNFAATLMTMVVPLIAMRLGLMMGNWGQHAFVDEDEPDSDFRSSITLIDVAVSVCLQHSSLIFLLLALTLYADCIRHRAIAIASTMAITHPIT